MENLNRKKSIALSFLLIALAVFTLTVPATAQEVNDVNLLDPNLEAELQMHGTIEGTGTYFEVTDSNYLNITFESTEPVNLRLESVPEMIVMDVNATNEAASTQITLTGFPPSTTYYKYEDDYHNEVTFTTDDSGSYTFAQDLTQPHLVFIQPNPGTKFIRDDATGGDAASIGTWDWATKTCTLGMDLTETIQIDSDGITLDGNGYTITGSNSGFGVYLYRRTAVTIKNINVQQFTYGIYLYRSSGNTLTGNTANSNKHNGIDLSYSSNNTLTNNIVSNNHYGMCLYDSSNNTLSNNTASNNQIGIYLRNSSNNNTLTANTASNNNNGIRVDYSNGNTLTANTASSNSYDGISLGYSSANTLTGNTASNNGRHGISIYGSDSILADNTMSDNRWNFRVSGNLDSHFDNNIDTSNTVDGKPIYYVKNAIGEVYDSSTNAGVFYAINCDRITIKDLTLTKNSTGVFLWNTHNSRIENVTASNNLQGMALWFSSNNSLINNIITNNDGGGIFCGNSSATIVSNWITGNVAAEGGGIYCIESALTIANNTITDNEGYDDCGGIFCNFSSILITNNVFARNWQGAIYCRNNSSLTVTNNTITDTRGTGVSCDNSSSVTINNSIVWGNAYQIYDGGEIVVSYSCVQGGWPGTGNFDADPLFADPTNGDYHLQVGSPCMDAGSNAALPADVADLDGDGDTTEPIPLDLDHNPRIMNGVVDMGAYEFLAVIPVEIDIKPGSYPNAINLGSYGLVPVAILSSEWFDATTVDPDTVELAGSDVAVRGKSNKFMAHAEDVNGDGLVDLLLQVATQNLVPDSLQDGYAVLTGTTYDGSAIEGSDEITIVPPEQ